MESGLPGDYIALVVRLQTAADGTWYVYIDGTDRPESIPLVPATLIIRIWRMSATGVLRGNIRLHGSDRWAPFQSNAQLEELVRAWLSGGGASPP